MKTATEAARLLRVSEKTVRDWLRKGKFPGARMRKIRGIMQWQIPEASVDVLVSLYTGSTDTSELEEDTESIGGSEVLQALERRVLSLEVKLAGVTWNDAPAPQIVSALPQKRAAPEPHRIYQRKSDDKWAGAILIHSTSELPEDAVLLYQFALAEGTNQKTLSDYVAKHGLPHYALPKQNRVGEMERYVTREQQEAIKIARSR